MTPAMTLSERERRRRAVDSVGSVIVSPVLFDHYEIQHGDVAVFPLRRVLQKLYRRLLLLGPPQCPRILEQEKRVSFGVEEKCGALPPRNALDVLFRADHPAWITSGERLEFARHTVFILQPEHHHVELKEAYRADDGRGACRVRARGKENLGRALLCELPEADVELLPPHRVAHYHAREMFGRESRNALELQVPVGREGIADAEHAAVHHADHVAGEGFLDGRALTRHELLWRRKPERLAG